VYTKNYRNWFIFYRVIPKTERVTFLGDFLGHSVKVGTADFVAEFRSSPDAPRGGASAPPPLLRKARFGQLFIALTILLYL